MIFTISELNLESTIDYKFIFMQKEGELHTRFTFFFIV